MRNGFIHYFLVLIKNIIKQLNNKIYSLLFRSDILPNTNIQIYHCRAQPDGTTNAKNELLSRENVCRTSKTV